DPAHSAFTGGASNRSAVAAVHVAAAADRLLSPFVAASVSCTPRTAAAAGKKRVADGASATLLEQGRCEKSLRCRLCFRLVVVDCNYFRCSSSNMRSTR